MNHIDFKPKSKKDALAFSLKLRQEIKIRFPEQKHKARLDEVMFMSTEDKVSVLKSMVKEEEVAMLAKTTIERYELKRDLAVALAVDKLVLYYT
jgi:arginine deiminase